MAKSKKELQEIRNRIAERHEQHWEPVTMLEITDWLIEILDFLVYERSD